MINCTALFTAQVQNLIESVATYERIKAAERARLEHTMSGARILVQKQKQRAEDTRNRVLRAVADHGPLSTEQVALKSGMALETARLHLRALSEAGTVRNAGSPKRQQWELT